jgi:ubiquinone/menaquinone biosynthesis C-methylase UbiE
MAEQQYVLSQTADAAERARLELWEHIEDARSQRHLAALGIQKGWQCLEIGAGHGSIVRWLAEQVGPQGRVVATDINPRFLTEMQLPNVEVRRHDIRTEPLEAGRYDLAHCRAVLSHVPDPPRVLRRMVAAVRMGGWVVIEDADFSSLRAVEVTHPLAASYNRHLRELLDRLTQAKLSDPYLGGRVRGLLDDAGLTEIDNEGVSRIARGGETEARMLCMTLQALVERGLLLAAAYSDLQQALRDPRFSFITLTTFAAWGKRAS